MTRFTVQCGYAAYYANTVVVEADTLDAALEKAIADANDDPHWKALDGGDGPTFVDAAAEGDDVDPWGDFGSVLPIPDAFTEHPTPLVTVLMEGGAIHDVEFEGRPCRLLIRDYDTEGAEPDRIEQDAHGQRFVPSAWGAWPDAPPPIPIPLPTAG